MFKGKITKIIYQTNDFIIGKLRDEQANKDITILGNIYNANKGDYIHIIEAKKEYHKNFGEQYRVIRWEKPIPVTRKAIIDFLCMIKHIGPVRANNIVNALGLNALTKIIEEGPEILRPIPAIGKRAEQIYLSVLEQYELQFLVQELSPLGLSLKHIMMVYKEIGGDRVKLIKKDPYILVDHNITSFQKADSIALSNGGSKESSRRIISALKTALIEALKLGHCYLPAEELIPRTIKILEAKLDQQVVAKELDEALNKGYLKAERGKIYLVNAYNAEKKVAQIVSALNRSTRPPRRIDSIIDQYERNTKITLAKKQREAIKSIFSNNIMVLTGGPGTGKTETIKAIVSIYNTIYPNHKIALAAPTGRASRRLAEMTHREASTIHRLLEYQPDLGPMYGKNRPLPYDLIIIDEFSMVDIFLAKDLFKAINPNTRVLMVGDKDQLPSVGPGNVFKDILETKIPIIELTEIFRQAQESQIVSNAHLVNQGKGIKIDPGKNDFYYIKSSKPEQILSLTRKSILRLIEKGYDISEIQVLVPTKRDEVGVYNLNNILQEAVNPVSKKGIKYGKTIFKVNDKVMQTENNYEKDVFNGDIGKIVDIGPLYEDDEKVEDQVLYVEYGDRLVTYRSSELDQIELAYATTIHKSQGGEYKAVIIVLDSQHYMMATRNLLYTAITRAEEFLCIIGSERTLIKAIKDDKISERYTSLAERINDYSKALMVQEV